MKVHNSLKKGYSLTATTAAAAALIRKRIERSKP